jgi:hypothetical protein
LQSRFMRFRFEPLGEEQILLQLEEKVVVFY